MHHACELYSLAASAGIEVYRSYILARPHEEPREQASRIHLSLAGTVALAGKPPIGFLALCRLS